MRTGITNGDCIITVNRALALKINCQYQHIEQDCFNLKVSYYSLLYKLDQLSPMDLKLDIAAEIEMSE